MATVEADPQAGNQRKGGWIAALATQRQVRR
jgi:hypothetical protein